jgi:hypothetical protein
MIAGHLLIAGSTCPAPAARDASGESCRLDTKSENVAVQATSPARPGWQKRRAINRIRDGAETGGERDSISLQKCCHPERSEGPFLLPQRSLASLGMTPGVMPRC